MEQERILIVEDQPLFSQLLHAAVMLFQKSISFSQHNIMNPIIDVVGRTWEPDLKIGSQI